MGETGFRNERLKESLDTAGERALRKTYIGKELGLDEAFQASPAMVDGVSAVPAFAVVPSSNGATRTRAAQNQSV